MSTQEVDPESGAEPMMDNPPPPPGMGPDGKPTVLVIVLCILFPWVGVLVYKGRCDGQVCLTVLLTWLGGFPGVIYALWVVGCCDSGPPPPPPGPPEPMEQPGPDQ